MVLVRIVVLTLLLGTMCTHFVERVASAGTLTINYSLAKPCRVSLAIYNKNGIQVRTLRNAEQQEAGPHSIAWDGLDQDGKPAAAGSYTWKLLEGQGLKSEYLFSLGVSTGDLPWPGNHSGPVGLAVNGDDVYVAAGAAEGCAQLVKMNQAGKISMAAAPLWSIEDVARADKLVYTVSTEMGRLTVFNGATGDHPWWTQDHGPMTVATVKDITSPVPTSTQGALRTFRYDVPHKPGWNWFLGKVTLRNDEDHPLDLKLSTSMSRGTPIALKDITLEPDETTTVDLGHVVVFADSDEQFIFGVEGVKGEEDCSVQRILIQTSADRVAACPEILKPGQSPAPNDANPVVPWAVSNNTVWVGYTRADKIQQIQPQMDGKVLREVAVPGFQDLAMTRDGRVLVLSGETVSVLNGETLEPVISNLDDPRRLSIDTATGDLFIAEGAPHQQILQYDGSYKRLRAFGRDGGRQYGLYKPEDFYHVDDVAGDGHGGFFAVENWGARRTVHIDANGSVVKEWYGGQGFQQWITQDPKRADRFWLNGTFNTDLVECQVNWAKRDWHVTEVYDIQDPLTKCLGALFPLPASYIGQRVHVMYKDLLGDGKIQRLLWIEGYPGTLMRIDEKSGAIVPLAAAGFLQDSERNMLMAGKPTPEEMQSYGPLLAAYASYPKGSPPPRYWTWADVNGDGIVQPDEMRLFAGPNNVGYYPGGFFCAMQMGDDLSVLQRTGFDMTPDQPSWYVMKPRGYTKCGAPIWQFDARTQSIATGIMTHALIADDGTSYEVRATRGEGYYVNGVSRTGGHGIGWPSTNIGATEVVCRAPNGQIRWSAGQHAPLLETDPGQLHCPMMIAGVVKNCVGVGDRVVNPLALWTTDGLFVGNLFDRTSNGGQPGIDYSWSEYNGQLPAGMDRGHFFDHLSINQYDMDSNGILGCEPNGDVYYISCGLNAAPIYRVTGWEDTMRQDGTVLVTKSVTRAQEAGTGLSATYYAEPEFKGEPTHAVDPQIWFGGKSSAITKPWPFPEITGKACSAVWEGFIQPRFTEPGRLLVYVDLGLQDPKATPPQRFRLWANGKLELDYWDKRAWDQPHLATRQFDWPAGARIPIRLEYSCDRPSDELSLCWESPSIPVEHVPVGCLYPLANPVPPSHVQASSPPESGGADLEPNAR